MSTSEPKELQDIEKREASRPEDSSERDATPFYNAHVDVSGIDEAKLIRKIDRQLLPWLSFLYLLTFLDRMSIGNAKVQRYSLHFGSALTWIPNSSTIWRVTYISAIKNIYSA
jgi:hypothetical protein